MQLRNETSLPSLSPSHTHTLSRHLPSDGRVDVSGMDATGACLYIVIKCVIAVGLLEETNSDSGGAAPIPTTLKGVTPSQFEKPETERLYIKIINANQKQKKQRKCWRHPDHRLIFFPVTNRNSLAVSAPRSCQSATHTSQHSSPHLTMLSSKPTQPNPVARSLLFHLTNTLLPTTEVLQSAPLSSSIDR